MSYAHLCFFIKLPMLCLSLPGMAPEDHETGKPDQNMAGQKIVIPCLTLLSLFPPVLRQEQ